MKRVFALLGILISLFLICGYIACSKIEYTSIDYGDWNDRTKAILAKQFEGILPNNISEQKNIQSYHYKFSQAVFGDENFVICVGLQAPDETAFDKYVDNYASELTSSFSQDDMTYYLFQYSSESVADYLDERIYDGAFYNFEIALVSKNDLTIQILAAHVWDYYRDEVLVDFLTKIVELNAVQT